MTVTSEFQGDVQTCDLLMGDVADVCIGGGVCFRVLL